MDILKFDANQANNLKKDFVTENSRDVSDNDILYAMANIERPTYTIAINTLLLDIEKSILIEMSIFEYALIHCTLNNFDKSFIPAIYKDKLEDMLLNLDESSYLENKTFKTAILQNTLHPKLVAFLSPYQLHPESWAIIIEKIRFKENKENSIAATDLYKCGKCKERKCKVNEIQMRSADEPMSKVITCLVCYNTFII
jgi:DNA-directed RNA polymerase subunit M/transcription elongation factor TFIIS